MKKGIEAGFRLPYFCAIFGLMSVMLTSVFSADVFTITATAGPGGQINPSGSVPAPQGSTIEFTMTANNGYCIKSVVADGEPAEMEVELPNSGTFTFMNIQGNHTISVTFVQCYDIYAGVANDGVGGTISPSGWERVEKGESRSYTITPWSGYEIDNVIVNNQSRGAISQLSLPSIDQNYQIFAFFAEESHTITASAGDGGSITPSGAVSVPHLGSQEFLIQPINSCYRIKSVEVDEAQLEGLPTQGGVGIRYRFNSVVRDHTIAAEFEPLDPYTITVITNGNGTVGPTQTGGVFGPGSGQFQVRVPCGGGWIFTITPDGCCRIAAIRVDGMPRAVQEELRFSSVGRDHTVEIAFEPIYLTIAPGVLGDGTINPQEPVSLPIGSSLACTMTPGPCQWVSDILVDGRSVMDSDTLISLLSTGNSMHRFSPMAMDRSRPGVLANGDSIIYPLPGTDTLTIDPVTGVFIYTFNQIESDHAIVPIFWELDFTVVTMAEGTATIAPLGEIDIPCSQTQLIQLESGGAPVADMYITIDNTYDASILWSAPDLKIIADDGFYIGGGQFTVGIEVESVNDPPFTLPQEITLGVDDAFSLAEYTVDDRQFLVFDYFESTTGFYILKDLVISEKIELTFVPSSHTVTSWVTWGYDIDTASIPYSIAPTLEQVEDGGSVSLRIEEALAEADCYDFELRITPEGGETVVVPKAHLIMGSQADVVNQVNVYTYSINNIRTNYTAELVYTRTTITIDIQTNDGGMIGPTQDGGTIGPEAGEFQMDLPCGGEPWQIEITPFGDNVLGDIKFNGDSLLDLILELFPDAANGVGESDEPLLIFPLTDPGAIDFRIYILSMPVIVDIPDLFPGAPVPYTDKSLPGEEFTRSSVPNDQPFKFTVDWNIDPLTEGDPPYELMPVALDPKFLVTHPIAVKAGPGGWVGIVQNRETRIYVLHGQDETFEVTPDPGYHIETVKIDGAEVELTDNNSFTHTFHNVVSDEHSIEATFAQNIYTITPSVEGNGTIDPPEAVQVAHGGSVTFTMVPADRHRIKDVLIDGESITSDGHLPVYDENSVFSFRKSTGTGVFWLFWDRGTYTFESVTSDHTIKVIFERMCVIKVETKGSGKVTGHPLWGAGVGPFEVEVLCGSSYYFIAIPDYCHFVRNVEVARESGERVSIMDSVTIDALGNGTFTLPNIQSDISVWVTFEVRTVTVTTSLVDIDNVSAIYTSPYSITPGGVTEFGCGDNVTLQIFELTLDAYCYDFNLVIHAEGSDEILIIPKKDLVRVEPSEEDIQQGIAMPRYEYVLEEIQTNYIVEVKYIKTKYLVSSMVAPGDDRVAHGTISPELFRNPVECMKSIEFTMTPESCYWIDDVEVTQDFGDPVSVMKRVQIDPDSGVGTYTLKYIQNDYSVSVIFKRRPLNVATSVKSGGDGLPHGTILSDGETKVECGSDLEITMEPDNCYELDEVMVTRGSGAPESVMEDVTEVINPDGSIHSYFYILRDITSDCRVEVTFKKLGPFYINASAGPGGKIEPGGAEIPVECGEDKIFTITPDQGYRLDALFVDGEDVTHLVPWGSGGFDYPFLNVRDNHTIHVTYARFFEVESEVVPGSDGTKHGVISPEKTYPRKGDSVTFTITPDHCYEIADVKLTRGEGFTVSVMSVVIIDSITGAGIYVLPDVQTDCVVEVTFRLLGPFTITVTSSDFGSISPKQDGDELISAGTFEVEVACGAGWVFKIKAHDCCIIKDVKLDGNSQGAREELIFSDVTTNYTVEITFEALGPYTITAKIVGDGTIIPTGGDDGKVEVECGEDREYTIVPGFCQKIADVLVDGKSVMGDVNIIVPTGTGKYTFEDVREDHTLEVLFETRYQIAKVKQNTGGRIEPAGAAGEVQIKCNTDQTFTITPDECYKIKNVKVDGEEVAVSINSITGVGRYTRTGVTEDFTIEATFEEVEFFTIEASVNDPKGGTIAPIGKVKVPCAQAKTFTITVNDCYEIDRLEVDGKEALLELVAGADDKFTYTFDKVVKDHRIKVFFKKLGPFTITGKPLPNGTVVPKDPVKVECGEDKTLTITPEDCWEIEWIDIDGVKVDMDTNPNFKVLDEKIGKSRYIFKNVRKDHTVTVKFKKIRYNIVATPVTPAGVPGPGGIVTPGTDIWVDCGDDITFRFTPNPGYRIAGIYLGTRFVGVGNSYTFKNVRSDQTLNILFVPFNSASIVALAGKGGKISPSGNVGAPIGANQKFEITVDEGYQIEDVKVNGESLGPVTEYTFEDLTGDQTISVTFIPDLDKGDANGDGEINSDDALSVLFFLTGKTMLTEEQMWAADVNGDGEVKIDDVVLILQMIATGLAAPDMSVAASIDRQIRIALDDVHGVSGESVIVPVRVDNIALIGGGDISIAYDSSVLRVVGIFSDAGALLTDNVAEPGMVRIAFASVGRLSSRTLAKIRFEVIADATSPLAFRRTDLYRPDALPLEVEEIDGRFESWSIPPERSALLQNFPNPFNPETWIPYQLREDSEVTVRIYSMTGELVREFWLGHRPAGLYVSQDRAAYWDGRNETGEQVASGIYFYSITAGDLSATRKMIVRR